MSSASIPHSSMRPIKQAVRRLRLMLRGYVLLEGLAILLMLLGGAFWIGLAFDWLFEPNPLVRGGMWLGLLVAAGWCGYRFLFSRLATRIADEDLALLVERKYPALDGSLLTSVQEAGHRAYESRGKDAFLRHTSSEAEQGLRHLELTPIFRLQPLLGKLAGAGLLWLLVFVFANVQSEAFAFWIERMQLSTELWPRSVHLSVAGFEQVNGRLVARVAKDDSFDLRVNASLEDEFVAPSRVEIRYRLPDGRRGRDDLIQVGEALPGRDKSQAYRYAFQHVGSDLELDIVGGDDRLRGLWLEVVERPDVVHVSLECEFPAYLNRAPQSIAAGTRVELAEGTHALCRVEASKPLTGIEVRDSTTQQDIVAQVSTEDTTIGEFWLGPIAEDHVLQITLRDQYGIENRTAYRMVVSVVPDMPPEVSVGLEGIGTAITSQANIPWAGEIRDEYGLQQVWYETQIEDNVPAQWEAEGDYQGKQKFDKLQSFDLAATAGQSSERLVDLQPGQQLALSVHASDEYDLGEGLHSGRSQRYLLDVVTESELRALLEKRELSLRQRFESIYEKMVATAELLGRIEIDVDNDASDLEEAEVQQILQRDRLRVGGCEQNAAQLSHETVGVAEGFEGIVTELVNNRIDTEELKERLSTNIAAPLREIGEVLLPELQATHKLLEESYADSAERVLLYTRAVDQSNEIVEQMNRVLERMLELESYNELVALLRSIVDEHKQLQQQTKEERRAKLRSILGND